MSQAWIDSILADEIQPLPFNERHLRDPKLAAIFQSHEQSRTNFAEYQNAIRHELETKGYVEIDDDYEMCELLEAVSNAAFYGREEEEKEAMAKLAALRR
jgi:signal transduction histidine kinase